MKYCDYGFEYFYLDTYEGNVMICPWMEPDNCSIGNILESSVEEIWHGEKAEHFRNLFRENCYKYCRPQGCPKIQNHSLEEINDIERFKELTKTPERPKYINLAYDFVCNQYCETCRNEVFIPPKDYKEKVENIRKKISPYIETAEELSASGHGDPFASPYMMDLLSNLKPTNKNLRFLLETNGVFLDEEHWARIEHLKDFYIRLCVTSNSFDEFTYNHISRGGNFKKLMNNLKFIKSLREKGYINEIISTFVIQDRNFRELPSFVERSLNEFGFDKVLLRPVYQWGTMPEKTFWFKDVLNPKHPYHSEYLEILQHPALKDERVYNFGGDTVHPARDFYIEEPACCCCEEEKKEVKPINKILAHTISSFIPNKNLRRKIRDEIKYSK